MDASSAAAKKLYRDVIKMSRDKVSSATKSSNNILFSSSAVKEAESADDELNDPKLPQQ